MKNIEFVLDSREVAAAEILSYCLSLLTERRNRP